MKNRSVQAQATGSKPARRWNRPAAVLTYAAALLAVFAVPMIAQKVDTGSLEPNVQHVLGFPEMKRGFKGVLSVQGDSLVMAWIKTKSSIKIADIVDVFTGDDTQQAIRGTAGNLFKAGVPYGGGRVLSLFSEATEVMTVEFKDAEGGFHGAVFIFPKGKASDLKKQLVAAGAHVSISPDAAAPKN